MKKIYILSLMICVLFTFLTGCNKASGDMPDTDINTSESEITTISEVTTPEITPPEVTAPEITTPEVTTEAYPPLDTTMYINSSDVYLLAADVECDYDCIEKLQTISFKERKFISETAVKEFDHIVLGKNYSLKYVESFESAHSDRIIDEYKYKVSDSKWAIMRFDSVTKEPVKYAGLPYEGTNTSEEDYLSHSQTLLKDIVDFSEFSFTKTQTYMNFITYDPVQTATFTTVDGFYIPQNEDERLIDRVFYFDKKNEEGYVTESVRITFFETSRRILIDISRSNIEEKDFDLDKIEKVKNSIGGIADIHLNYKYTLESAELLSSGLFTKNGTSYISLTIEIRFSPDDNPNVQFSSLLQVAVDVTPKK